MTHARFVSLSLAFVLSICLCDRASAQVKYVYKSAAERRQDEKLKDQKQDVKKAQNELKGEAKLAKEQAQLDKAKFNDATHVNTPRGRRPRTKKK